MTETSEQNRKRHERTTVEYVDGVITISCNMGLWSVSGPTNECERIVREAIHYYRMCEIAGEYDD